MVKKHELKTGFGLIVAKDAVTHSIKIATFQSKHSKLFTFHQIW